VVGGVGCIGGVGGDFSQTELSKLTKGRNIHKSSGLIAYKV